MIKKEKDPRSAAAKLNWTQFFISKLRILLMSLSIDPMAVLTFSTLEMWLAA